MKHFMKRLLISLVMLMSAAPLSVFAAEGTDGNRPEASFHAEADSSDLLEVTLFARNAVDVYAYQLSIRYDAQRLELKETEVPVRGFTVPPEPDDGSLLIAHTMVGPVKGLDGTIELAKLRFERTAPGDAAVTLHEAKLVSSDIESVTYAPELAVVLADPAARLIDIDGHWAKAAIEEGVRIGFIGGYPDGTFRPDDRVTRAEFAAMLVRALELPIGQGEAPDFSDAGGLPEWAVPYAAAAAAAGLIEGYDDGSFRAGAHITRAETAAILVRAMGGAQPAGSADFADREEIPEWAAAYAAAAHDAGIMQGRPDGRFDPLANSTRAEAVVTILRLLKL